MRRRNVIIGAGLALLGVACGTEDGRDPDGKSVPKKDAGPKPIRTRGAGPRDTKDDDHNGVPDPWEPQDDFNEKVKVATISVWVEPQFCPYTVDAVIEDANGQVVSTLTGGGASMKWIVSEGQWRQVAPYESNAGMVLRVQVQASKPGSTNGYIAVRDGVRLHRSWSFNGTSSATAEYHLAR